MTLGTYAAMMDEKFTWNIQNIIKQLSELTFGALRTISDTDNSKWYAEATTKISR